MIKLIFDIQLFEVRTFDLYSGGYYFISGGLFFNKCGSITVYFFYDYYCNYFSEFGKVYLI